MYSNPDRPHLQPVKGLFSGLAELNKWSGGKFDFLGAAGVQPLDVATVGRAVIEATLDENVKGVLDTDDLARLGA
jgi:hypothetical protein